MSPVCLPGCTKQPCNLVGHGHDGRHMLNVSIAVGRAVNQQKDIVFDGTMTWAPFVKQTLAMVRDHRHTYRRGPGYTADDAGHTVELCATLCSLPYVESLPLLHSCGAAMNLHQGL